MQYELTNQNANLNDKKKSILKKKKKKLSKHFVAVLEKTIK